MRQPSMRIVIVLALLGAALGTSVVAFGQDHQAHGRAEAPAPTTSGGSASSDDSSGDAQSKVVKEGGEKVKVIKFGGLAINGRLKSPQLLYFLKRLRAEFDRPRLPHRSFIPELVRSAKSDTF